MRKFLVLLCLIFLVSASVSAVEKRIYLTDFSEWGDYEQNEKQDQPKEATWTTTYTKESLTFSVFHTKIGSTNFNTGKFPNWTGGMLMAAKSDDPYIETSALASITKVIFVHGATGSNRGWKLWAKGDGDSDWVLMSDAAADPSSGATVEVAINKTNCQLKFTNITNNQNAYLFSLEIYSDIDESLIVDVPKYTVTYYDTDGTTAIGTQTVEEDATIGTFAKGQADVTVAKGKAFRGWFASAAGGRKVREDEKIAKDLALYAIATDIETASTTARYTYNLTSQYFYDEDHEAINILEAAYHDGTHGWEFSSQSKMELLVGGKAYILLSLCQYGNGTLTLCDSNDNTIKTFDAKASKDGATIAIEYTGAAGTLVLYGDANYYIHKVTIANMEDSPVERTEQGIYVVKAGDAANFLNTLMIANSTANSDTRTIIFLPDGTYDLGSECLTPVSGDNISIIGQSTTGTIIKNTPEAEGIGVTATLYNTSKNLYLQDLTLQNAYPYDSSTGRAVCLQDKGSRTICKNVELQSFQDTYYSNANSQFYFESSNIHGTVDFICGQGDVYFNNCTLTIEKRSSGCTIAAPYTDKSNQFGYVFNNCTINSLGNTSYNFGRAWGGVPRCAYLNTTLLQPDCLVKNRWTAAGMNVAADKFVEYNTMDENGTVVSPSSHVMTFTKDQTSNEMETILTDEQAAEYSIDKVFTDWTPTTLTRQCEVSSLKLSNNTLSWELADDGACYYAVFKNDTLLGFTEGNTYAVDTEDANYKVRAANKMGGLGVASSVGNDTGINQVGVDLDTDNSHYYNINGIQVPSGTKGLLIHNGKKTIAK